MTNIIKPAEELNSADLAEHPVWEFINDDAIGETAVRPILKLPVATMDNRLIGLQATLANGKASGV